MARLPPAGRMVASLYERSPETDERVACGRVDPRECVTTLTDAIAGLGLAPLSPDDEQKVRQNLQVVIGRAMQEDARPQVAAVQTTIRRVARTLTSMAAGRRVKSESIEQIEQTLRSRETGLHQANDLDAANAIWNALAGIVGDRDEAEAMMSMGQYLIHAREIADACRVADKRLGNIVGNSGQPAIDWYADFVGVLKFIAAKNNIRPTIATDPVTSKRQGRFLDLAGAIELVLPLKMRSATNEARAQRLRRALRHN